MKTFSKHHHDHLQRASQLAGFAARLVDARSFRQPRGMFVSGKMGCAINWTFAAQRDAITLLELHHDVLLYETWPEPTTLIAGGVTFDYHFPIGLTLKNGRRAVVDLVQQENTLRPEWEAVKGYLHQALAVADTVLLIRDEASVRSDRCLANARAVMRAVGWHIDDEAEYAVLALLRQRGARSSLHELHQHGDRGAELSATACVLAMRRVLCINLRVARPDECIVSLPEAA